MSRILAPNSSSLLEISSFIIRVMEMRATTVVIPMVNPRMRKKTFPFRLRRLLIEMSLSFILLYLIYSLLIINQWLRPTVYCFLYYYYCEQQLVYIFNPPFHRPLVPRRRDSFVRHL